MPSHETLGPASAVVARAARGRRRRAEPVIIMSEKWEYKIIHVGAERWTATGLPVDLNQRFDEIGADGWELVAVVALERPSFLLWGGSKTVGVVATFKRRVVS